MRYFFSGAVGLFLLISPVFSQIPTDSQPRKGYIKIERISPEGEKQVYSYNLHREFLKDSLEAPFKLRGILKNLEIEFTEDFPAKGNRFRHFMLNGVGDSALMARIKALESDFADSSLHIQVLSLQSDSLQQTIRKFRQEWGGKLKNIEIFQTEDFHHLSELDEEVKQLLEERKIELAEAHKIIVLKYAKETETARLLSSDEIKENNSRKNWVFPNPTSSQLTISYADLSNEPLSLQITDMQGKEVFRKKFMPKDGTLTEELELPASLYGTYILRFKQGNEIWQEKIIIN